MVALRVFYLPIWFLVSCQCHIACTSLISDREVVTACLTAQLGIRLVNNLPRRGTYAVDDVINMHLNLKLSNRSFSYGAPVGLLSNCSTCGHDIRPSWIPHLAY